MAFYSSFLLFPILLPNIVLAQTYTNISLGTTLTPLNLTSNWPSPSGDFAFGFRPLETNSSLFLLAVYFNKIRDKTIVWTANGDNPVTNQSKAELTYNGRLSLKDLSNQEIWNAKVNTADYASMLDTGNFVLASASSGIIWQTFEDPTDTILPSQVLNQGSVIDAKLMDDDYSPGRFQLTLQDDGNLVMNAVASPSTFTHDAYFSTGTSGMGVDRLVFDETGSMYLLFANDSKFSVLSAPADAGDKYVRATLDSDGVFRQYSFPKSNLITGSWKVEGSKGSDICNHNFKTGSGSCGFNSNCTLDASGKSNCQCPDPYSFIDPSRKYKGCKPSFSPQICEPGGEALFQFMPVSNLDWPLDGSDSQQYSPINDTDCTNNCLNDCFCVVAIYSSTINGGTCWKKRFPLSNGRMNSNVDRTAFIKFSTLNSSTSIAPSDSSEGANIWKTLVLVVSPILGGSLILNLVLIGSCCFICIRSKHQIFPPNSSSITTGPSLCTFTYKELEQATNGFSEEIGKGAFSTVYKGVLPAQPRTPIAVKKLEESLVEEAEKDFSNEVTTIGQTHHKNLVRLLGYCKEGAYRLMVFEYMSKGSLNKFLFGNERPEWNQRVQIALGIAGGLAYLHEECRTQIIHCDIKPQNILLDDNLEARISDFGLAKLLRLEQTRTRTGIRGTIGYFAPEWFKNIAVTTKVDVYSFGVMLLEMICCRRNFEWRLESQEKATVIDWANECYRNGRLDLLVEDDEEAKRDGMRLERFVIVGISCIQDEPWLRPSMKKVVQMLEGAIAVSIPPNMYSIHS